MAQVIDSSELQPGGLENYLTGSFGTHSSTLHPSDGLKLHRWPTTLIRSTSAYKRIPEPHFKTSSCEVLAESAKPSDVVITQHPFVYVDPKPAKRTKRLNRLNEFPGCLVFDSHPTPRSGARHRVNHPVSPENIGEVDPHALISGEILPLTGSLESHFFSISSASPSQSSFPGATAWPLLHQRGPYTASDCNGGNESFRANACDLSQVNQCEGGGVMIHPDAVTAGDGSTWQLASNRAGDTRDIPPSLPQDTREPGYGAPSTNGQSISESQFYSHTAHFVDDSHDIDAYNAQHAYSSRSLNCRFDTRECSVHRTLTHHHMRTDPCGCTLLYRASGTVRPVGVLIYDKGHGYEDTSAHDGIAPDTFSFEPLLLELGAQVPFKNDHRCFST